MRKVTNQHKELTENMYLTLMYVFFSPTGVYRCVCVHALVFISFFIISSALDILYTFFVLFALLIMTVKHISV